MKLTNELGEYLLTLTLVGIIGGFMIYGTYKAFTKKVYPKTCKQYGLEAKSSIYNSKYKTIMIQCGERK